jgi:glucan phosphoethanolaminetransferase (alkaline phosphatase superfamily)
MKLSDLARRMIIIILITAFACVLISVVYYRSLKFLPFMIGVLLGTAVSIFKVFLLEYTVNNALTMEKTKASGYVSIQYILRFLLTGIILYLGAVVPQISIWGVAVEIFNERNVEVVVGASGNAKTAVENYLKGELKTTGSVCHEHQHHDECGE